MQDQSRNLPALTIVVTGFNQEDCIRGAIESVLNQDYEGDIEYIFSDDSSSDSTFEVMREMKNAYKGNRVIKLNRNEENMGITRHLEKIYSLASHDWVVRMDGDDRSLPYRCRMIAEAIMRYPRAVYITSDVVKVVCKCCGTVCFPQVAADDVLDAFIPEEGTTRKSFLGTTSAIRHASRAPYSEMKELAMCEDLYEAHRAWLNEQLVVLGNKLVLYVEHDSNMSRVNPGIKNRDIKSFLKGMERLKKIYQSFIQANEAIVRLTENFLQSCPSGYSPHLEAVRRDLKDRKDFIHYLSMENKWPDMTIGQKLRSLSYFRRNPLRILPLQAYGRLLCLLYRLKR